MRRFVMKIKGSEMFIRLLGIAVIAAAVLAGNVAHTVFGKSAAQQEQSQDGGNRETAGDELEEEDADEAEGDDDELDDDESEEEETEEPKLKKPKLRAASKPDGSMKISWNRVDGAAEYVLFRSKRKDGGFRRVYKTVKTCRYMDKACTVGQVYYYRLTVFSKGRRARTDSRIIKGCPLDKVELTEISNLSGSRKMALRWKKVKGAAGYRIKRKKGTGEYETAAVVKRQKTSYTDKKLEGGSMYSYRVCAIDAGGGRGNYSGALSQMAIDASRKMIALTYDDGPSAYTPIVLDALKKYGAHATFFVVGNRVNLYSDSIRSEAALGCEIGNHTYAHDNLRSLSLPQVQSVLGRTNQAVKQQAGVDIHIMRPPGGSYTAAVCAAAGMPVILWSVDTLDWRTRSTTATIQCVQQKAFDGAIVLMHDLHQPTAHAADAILKYLKDAGYQMVTVTELAAYRGGMSAGNVYSQFRR